MDKVKLAALKADVEQFEQWCRTVHTIPNAIVMGDEAFRFLLENTILDRSEPVISQLSAANDAAEAALCNLTGMPFYIDKHMHPRQIRIGVMTFYQGIPDFRTLQVITV